MAETTNLKFVQCQFESDVGHMTKWHKMTEEFSGVWYTDSKDYKLVISLSDTTCSGPGGWYAYVVKSDEIIKRTFYPMSSSLEAKEWCFNTLDKILGG